MKQSYLAFGVVLGLSFFSMAGQVSAQNIGELCSDFGATQLSVDGTTVLGCLKQYASQANCGTAASPTCIWKSFATPEVLLRVSFEIVGAGGGGGGMDSGGTPGTGGSGDVLRFDVLLPAGRVLTISPGGGGSASSVQGNLDYGDSGGSGLFASGGHGGMAGVRNDGTVHGASGRGGGGGAASVVIGDDIFAVAAGGGGGGGASCNVNGASGNVDGQGGASGPNGAAGKAGCNGDDGGGGGGGGGGYPGGAGGLGGCDYDRGNLVSRGGKKGTSYYSGTTALAFTRSTNNSGVGSGGAPYANGQCGRVTIWSSTGTKYQFDCNTSSPQWKVQ